MTRLFASFALFSAIALTGCGADATGSTASGDVDIQSAEDADVGAFLTNEGGLTVYVFSKDTKGDADHAPVSNCTGGCLANWPIVASADRISDDLDASLFGSFVRTDGATQATYKGWPLYTFAGDKAPGELNAHGNGDTWFAAGTPLPTLAEEPTITALNDSELGEYIADESGIALYVFTKDSKGVDGADPVSACEGGCLETWPVFHAGELRAPDGLDAALFGVYVRPDGTYQSTYKGWPLYYHNLDAAAGELHGHGIGDVWFAAGTPLP